jgi:hypothetical protein
MRSFINTTTVMSMKSDRQDRVDVAGMVELRQGGPQRPHLYWALRTLTARLRLSGAKPSCSPARRASHEGLERHCSARLGTHRRPAWHGATRIS